MKDLDLIIQGSLETKRAVAVKMSLNGYTVEQICNLLNVSKGFIDKWRARYNKEGVSCFAIAYKGSERFLSKKQLEDVFQFINSKRSCRLEELINYIQNEFKVVYKSKQSYYFLFEQCGMSWKKIEKSSPKKDGKKVALKKDELKKIPSKKRKNTLRGFGRVNVK